jgi:GNAT superfamily N-acetyltransferase
MYIERFDPRADADRIRACHQMLAAGKPADDPHGPPMSLPVFTGWWACGWIGDPRQTWLATGASGEPVGCYLLELPERDNMSTGYCVLVVSPAARRAGIGTALLRHCAEQAARAGRRLLVGDAGEDSPGARFARALGARPGLADVRRVLDIDASLAGRLQALRAAAEPHAAGYSLLSWSGPAAEEHVDQVAAVTAAMADAPRDPDREAEQWDASRVRAADQRVAVQGLRYYSVAARCEETGELAALTQLGTDPLLPVWAFQELTAVARQHRGHRLGMLVKVAMLDLFIPREPLVRRILTANGEDNEHMVAINAQLGYQVLDKWHTWGLNVADILAGAAAPRSSARPGSG